MKAAPTVLLYDGDDPLAQAVQALLASWIAHGVVAPRIVTWDIVHDESKPTALAADVANDEDDRKGHSMAAQFGASVPRVLALSPSPGHVAFAIGAERRFAEIGAMLDDDVEFATTPVVLIPLEGTRAIAREDLPSSAWCGVGILPEDRPSATAANLAIEEGDRIARVTATLVATLGDIWVSADTESMLEKVVAHTVNPTIEAMPVTATRVRSLIVDGQARYREIGNAALALPQQTAAGLAVRAGARLLPASGTWIRDVAVALADMHVSVLAPALPAPAQLEPPPRGLLEVLRRFIKRCVRRLRGAPIAWAEEFVVRTHDRWAERAEEMTGERVRRLRANAQPSATARRPLIAAAANGEPVGSAMSDVVGTLLSLADAGDLPPGLVRAEPGLGARAVAADRSDVAQDPHDDSKPSTGTGTLASSLLDLNRRAIDRLDAELRTAREVEIEDLCEPEADPLRTAPGGRVDRRTRSDHPVRRACTQWLMITLATVLALACVNVMLAVALIVDAAVLLIGLSLAIRVFAQLARRIVQRDLAALTREVRRREGEWKREHLPTAIENARVTRIVLSEWLDVSALLIHTRFDASTVLPPCAYTRPPDLPASVWYVEPASNARLVAVFAEELAAELLPRGWAHALLEQSVPASRVAAEACPPFDDRRTDDGSPRRSLLRGIEAETESATRLAEIVRRTTKAYLGNISAVELMPDVTIDGDARSLSDVLNAFAEQTSGFARRLWRNGGTRPVELDLTTPTSGDPATTQPRGEVLQIVRLEAAAAEPFSEYVFAVVPPDDPPIETLDGDTALV